MKVSGIRGLERAVPFKQAAFPGFNEREYRIAQEMDAAAALLADGRLISGPRKKNVSLGRSAPASFPSTRFDTASLKPAFQSTKQMNLPMDSTTRPTVIFS